MSSDPETILPFDKPKLSLDMELENSHSRGCNAWVTMPARQYSKSQKFFLQRGVRVLLFMLVLMDRGASALPAHHTPISSFTDDIVRIIDEDPSSRWSVGEILTSDMLCSTNCQLIQGVDVIV